MSNKIQEALDDTTRTEQSKIAIQKALSEGNIELAERLANSETLLPDFA